MTIHILAVGKLKEKYLKQAIEEYEKRLKVYTKIKITEIPDLQAPENLSEKDLEKLKEKEGEKILGKIKDSDYVITLEILGRQLSSEKFANLLEKEMIEGMGRDIVFVIGGSNGLSKQVMFRSDYALSFSEMTFPHQLMRVILMEQIYRAFRIINNHPYHKWFVKEDNFEKRY